MGLDIWAGRAWVFCGRDLVRRILGLAVAAVAVPIVAALLVTAAEVRIVDFGSDGTLSWTNDFTEVAPFHILETIDLMGDWSTNASGSQNPGELTVTNVSVTETQKFYRVSAESNPPAGTSLDLGKVLEMYTNWFGGGDALWFPTNEPGSPAWDTVDSAESGPIGDSQATWFGAYFEGPIDVDFYWMTECEPFDGVDGDYLRVLVGTTEQDRVSGDMGAWEHPVLTLGVGTHLVKWEFVRDGSLGLGRNAAWVDHVTATPKKVLILEGESADVVMSEDGDPIPFDLELHAYVESGSAEWSIYSNAVNGVANTNGGSATNQVIVYAPAEDWSGMDSFVVQVISGPDFDRILVNVDVQPVADPPAIVEGTNVPVTMSEDGDPTPFELTLHADDPDTPGTNLYWTILVQPANGSADVGTMYGASQAILYEPPTNWNTYSGTYAACVPGLSNAAPESFVVKVEEVGGSLSTTTVVVVEIEPRNDPPTNLAPPTIVGQLNVGKQLTVSAEGTWGDSDDINPTPPGCFLHLFQWQRRTNAVPSAPWTDIGAATGSDYTLVLDDLAMDIRVRETVLDSGEGLPSWREGSTNSGFLGPVGPPLAEDIPTGMVFVAGGSVVLGGLPAEEAPTRTNNIASFYIDTCEVSKALWDQVRTWGSTHGYTDIAAGRQGYTFNTTNGTHGPAPSSDHPVTDVTWFDCVKWCNARSEMESRTPVYYTGSPGGTVYRTGEISLTSGNVDWDAADGYRLPTEAEWEKAARGGAAGLLYPWGNTIDGSDANYRNSGDVFELEGGAVQGTTPVGHYDGGQTPAGGDMANGFGMYDVAGNVREWCWDRYTSTPAKGSSDPRGPDTGIDRLCRGGACYVGTTPYTSQLRCADRMLAKYSPTTHAFTIGFRTVRGR